MNGELGIEHAGHVVQALVLTKAAVADRFDLDGLVRHLNLLSRIKLEEKLNNSFKIVREISIRVISRVLVVRGVAVRIQIT